MHIHTRARACSKGKVCLPCSRRFAGRESRGRRAGLFPLLPLPFATNRSSGTPKGERKPQRKPQRAIPTAPRRKRWKSGRKTACSGATSIWRFRKHQRKNANTPNHFPCFLSLPSLRGQGATRRSKVRETTRPAPALRGKGRRRPETGGGEMLR